MLRTLYARLAAVLVVIFVAIGISYGIVTSATVESYLQELNQHFNRDLAKRIVADRNLVAEGRLDDRALKETFSAYMDINPSIEIYLLDLEGGIIAFSADPGRVKRQRVDLGPIEAFMHGEDFPLLGDDPRSHDRRKAFSVTPVPSAKRPEGYLYVVLLGEQYESAERLIQESYVLRLSAWAVAGSLGFGLIAGLLIFHLLTRRLQRLSTIMQAFQESGFSRHQPFAPEPGGGGDEIERLGSAFDRIAARLVSQLEELKSQDKKRRDLVAQVSHDLRTPLAALHGYLETLRMKGGRIDSEEQSSYLEVALRQSNHLKFMVEALFELAHLEARDTQPKTEPCALGELLQDVMQKFRLRAEEGSVELRVHAPLSAPLVEADIALTERALDNLISNALEHTPEGGWIDLELALEDDCARIAILDNGPGIAEDELAHLFEPFYRGGQRTPDRRHAGLGLAIARRIVELQGGRLWAENLPQGGARFCFTLPLSRLPTDQGPRDENVNFP